MRNTSGVRRNRKTWVRGRSSNRDCERYFAPKLHTPVVKPAPARPSARLLGTSASKPDWSPTRFRFSDAAIDVALGSRSAAYISNEGIGCGRMAIVALALNKGVIHQQS